MDINRSSYYLEPAIESEENLRWMRLIDQQFLSTPFHGRPRTTTVATNGRVYPYLLRDRELTRVNEVWSSDITYVPMRHGFMYLTAVIDWYNMSDLGLCMYSCHHACKTSVVRFHPH